MSLQIKYKTEVLPALRRVRGYKNEYAAPRVIKAVVNTGLGRVMAQTQNAEEKILPNILDNLAFITGQRPATTRARKSISGFKIRQGQVIGAKATLRGKRMYDFLDRFIHLALPRVRDFRGIPLKNVDGGGNLTIGIKEYTVFPEVPLETLKATVGLEITVCTTAKSREEAIELLRGLGFPLQRK